MFIVALLKNDYLIQHKDSVDQTDYITVKRIFYTINLKMFPTQNLEKLAEIRQKSFTLSNRCADVDFD